MSGPPADRWLIKAIRHAYEDSADGWASGPVSVYQHLARALLEVSATPLAGRRVLDLGAGTGVASEALVAAGARPVAVDLAHAMLRHRRAQRPPGAVGDALALPFHDQAFDAVVAAFSLNHLPDPAAGLAECRRVTRSGGLVLASAFPNDADHPAKAIVESVLVRYGYQRPPWYEAFKDRFAALTGDPDTLAAAASDAGLTGPGVERLEIDVGLDRPELAVDWRLNMPHTIDFVAGLDPDTQAALRDRAVAELSSDLPSQVAMLVLRATVR